MRRLFERIKHHFIPTKKNAYRPHIFGWSWLLFFAMLILATEAYFVSGLLPHLKQNLPAAVISAEVITLTNGERTQNNVGQLKENPLLDAAAQAKATDMAAKGYFSHVGPDGKDPWSWIEVAGYNYQYAGENLAVQFTDSADVVSAWMQSPTHRANIIKVAYAEIGVGVAQGMYEGRPATFVVQYFGSPRVAVSNTQKTAVTKVQNTASSKPVAIKSSNEPQVEGAATGPASAGILQQPTSPGQSLLQQLQSFPADPREITSWIFGLVAALLVGVIGLSFFFRHHTRRTDMIVGGGLVAAFALICIVVNATVLPFAIPISSQTAGVAGSLSTGNTSVIISAEGASIERN